MWDNPSMEIISNWLQTYLGIDPAAQQKLLISVLIVATLWLIQRVLRTSITERIQSLERRYQWQKALGYIFTTLGVLSVGLVWVVDFGQRRAADH